MNFSTYRFSLDLQSHKSQVSLPVMLGDTKTKLYIILTDGGKPFYIEDGCRAVFVGIKADGNQLVNDCIIENNSTIRYDFTEQTATKEGIVKCEIRLYDVNSYKLTSPKFIMVVDARVMYDNDVISESELSAIDKIFTEENKRVEAEKEREARTDAKIEEIDAEFDKWDAARTGAELAVSNAEKWATGSEVESDPQHNNSAKDWAESLTKLGNQAGGYPVLEEIEGEEYPKIPSVYLNQVDIKEYKKITDESQLNTVDAQKHDVAVLVEPEEVYDEEKGEYVETGELVITKSWLLYDVAEDGTREWIKFGLSYATNAGYATYANNAGNASKVNQLVIKGMTESDYNNDLNKENGVYFVSIGE